jgi:hypothetical protein
MYRILDVFMLVDVWQSAEFKRPLLSLLLKNKYLKLIMEIEMFILGIILKMHSRYVKVGSTHNNHSVTWKVKQRQWPS